MNHQELDFKLNLNDALNQLMMQLCRLLASQPQTAIDVLLAARQGSIPFNLEFRTTSEVLRRQRRVRVMIDSITGSLSCKSCEVNSQVVSKSEITNANVTAVAGGALGP